MGIKQLSSDPWTDITSKYPVGSRHKGVVRNFTNFGVFLELEEGIDGLIYISDLSWTEKVKHPSEFCAVGDALEVEVVKVDVDDKKIDLKIIRKNTTTGQANHDTNSDPSRKTKSKKNTRKKTIHHKKNSGSKT